MGYISLPANLGNTRYNYGTNNLVNAFKPNSLTVSAPPISATQAKSNYNAANMRLPAYRPPGQILGTQSTSNPPSGGGAPSMGGGGSSPAPQSAPSGQQYSEAPQIPQPQAPSIDFDALIQPALDAYTQLEQGQTAGLEGNISSIGQQAETQKSQATTAKASQEAQLGQQEQQYTNTTENAINESRRAAAEMQQGLLARFGAGVSTGLGASAILGSQAVRNIGDYRSQLNQVLGQINDTRASVLNTYNDNLKEIETWKGTQVNQARANLQQVLAQISMAKGQLQSRKAEMAYNAMEQYRQEQNQVNTLNAQFQQTLYSNAQTALQKLQQVQAAASNKVKSTSNWTLSKDSLGNPIRVNTQAGVSEPIKGVTTSTRDTNNLAGVYDPELDQIARKL